MISSDQDETVKQPNSDSGYYRRYNELLAIDVRGGSFC